MQELTYMSIARAAATATQWPFEWARGVRRSQAAGATAAFDLARTQYAAGVRAGLIKRSLLASSAFERRLCLLERLTLGPWARSV